MWRALLLATLLLSVAGCSSKSQGGDNEAPETLIEGWVLDYLLRPIEGAQVAVVGGSTSATDESGRYQIKGLPVGTYTLRASGDNVLEATRVVDIRLEGQFQRVNFTLSPKATTEPRLLTEQFDGFIECSAFVTAEHSHGGGGRPDGDNPLDCGTYATTQSVWTQEIPAGVDTIVFELVWDPNTELADRLLVIVDQVLPSGDLDYILFAEGPSPVKLQVPYLPSQERFQKGGTVQLDVQIGGSEEDIAAGAAIQQDFTVFSSYFFNQVPDPDYSIL